MAADENLVQDFAKAYPSLARESPEILRSLLETASVVNVPPGAPVFHEGDACSNYLLVLSGSVRVQKVSESGREIVLYRVDPGQTCILTTCCLISGEEYPAAAFTETEVRALAIPRARFQELLARSAVFREFAFSVYAKRISGLIALVEEVAFGRMDERLAAWLGERCHSGDGLIEATHQQIATELGTLREVISRLLKDFERRGKLALGRGRIEIRDLKAFRAAAERSRR